jgi:hypothetical protein
LRSAHSTGVSIFRSGRRRYAAKRVCGVNKFNKYKFVRKFENILSNSKVSHDIIQVFICKKDCKYSFYRFIQDLD